MGSKHMQVYDTIVIIFYLYYFITLIFQVCI